MRFLLDTHAFLWMIGFVENLSKKAKDIIEDANTVLYLSSASVWEIVIKHQINKIELPDNPVEYISSQMKKNIIEDLPITFQHTINIYNLPDIHKDPFDRIILSQSMVEQIPIISCDRIFKKYKANVIW